MRRLIGTTSALLVVAGAIASPARAEESVCVGDHPGCHSTLQGAVDAAQAGDTIHLMPGVHAGGVTIDVSVTITGSGADSTVIRGGASVLTIGELDASSQPTVTLTGVTVTGGVASSSPQSIPFTGAAGVLALGGGISIPPSAEGPGATVTLVDTVVTGNRAAPSATLPVGPPCPGDVPCPFAAAQGGGIDNWGALTLRNTTISDNVVGSAPGLSDLASDAEGAGIMSHSTGSLSVHDSVISGNHARVTAPNGRFADGGGVFVRGDSFTMDHVAVRDNSASVSTAFPATVEMLAVAGGIHVGPGTSATIRHSRITGNSVAATNSVGDATAFSGGLHADRAVVLSDNTIADNRVTATTSPGSSGNASADSGAGGINESSVITSTHFVGNVVTATSSSGDATAYAGAIITAGNPATTIDDSAVRSNRVTASATTGSAVAQGAGIYNIGLLRLGDTLVRKNVAAALGLAGAARGGGVWSSPIPDGPPEVGLALEGSAVTRNAVTASSGITPEGGGIYSSTAVQMLRSVVRHNTPDQCFGC